SPWKGHPEPAAASRSKAHLLKLSGSAYRAVAREMLPRADVIPPLARRSRAPFLGGLVVQLDHNAVGVIDEDLPEVAARHLAGVEFHALGLQALLHAVKTGRGEGDVMDNAGIRLLCLFGLGNVDQMHHRLALAVHPRAGESEVRPGALLECKNVLIEANGISEVAGPDVEMIEHAHAHAHAKHSLFCEVFVKSIFDQQS